MRWLIALVISLHTVAASAQIAELCDNGADDDADELADCADSDCAVDASCASVEVTTSEAPEVETAADLPEDDPRRYPQKYVLQPLTYLEGMLVPALGISTRDDFAFEEMHAHFGIGLTYGIFDFWEISILPIPVRVSPTAAYEDPSISTTVRFLDHEVIELGLYANVAIPVTQTVGEPERLVTEHLLARSRSGSVAELDIALLARLHLGEIARLDLAVPVATFVFASDVRVDVAIPLRLSFQLTPFAYAGLWSGIILSGSDYGAPKVPLGFVFGATFPGMPRGPILDAGVRFGWPTFFDPERIEAEVSGDGWQVTVEARLLTYLLP